MKSLLGKLEPFAPPPMCRRRMRKRGNEKSSEAHAQEGKPEGLLSHWGRWLLCFQGTKLSTLAPHPPMGESYETFPGNETPIIWKRECCWQNLSQYDHKRMSCTNTENHSSLLPSFLYPTVNSMSILTAKGLKQFGRSENFHWNQ